MKNQTLLLEDTGKGAPLRSPPCLAVTYGDYSMRIQIDPNVFVDVALDGNMFKLGLRARERLFNFIDAIQRADDDVKKDFDDEYRLGCGPRPGTECGEAWNGNKEPLIVTHPGNDFGTGMDQVGYLVSKK